MFKSRFSIVFTGVLIAATASADFQIKNLEGSVQIKAQNLNLSSSDLRIGRNAWTFNAGEASQAQAAFDLLQKLADTEIGRKSLKYEKNKRTILKYAGISHS